MDGTFVLAPLPFPMYYYLRSIILVVFYFLEGVLLSVHDKFQFCCILWFSDDEHSAIGRIIVNLI
jgi:hypothetical protein